MALVPLLRVHPLHLDHPPVSRSSRLAVHHPHRARRGRSGLHSLPHELGERPRGPRLRGALEPALLPPGQERSGALGPHDRPGPPLRRARASAAEQGGGLQRAPPRVFHPQRLDFRLGLPPRRVLGRRGTGGGRPLRLRAVSVGSALPSPGPLGALAAARPLVLAPLPGVAGLAPGASLTRRVRIARERRELRRLPRPCSAGGAAHRAPGGSARRTATPGRRATRPPRPGGLRHADARSVSPLCDARGRRHGGARLRHRGDLERDRRELCHAQRQKLAPRAVGSQAPPGGERPVSGRPLHGPGSARPGTGLAPALPACDIADNCGAEGWGLALPGFGSARRSSGRHPHLEKPGRRAAEGRSPVARRSRCPLRRRAWIMGRARPAVLGSVAGGAAGPHTLVARPPARRCRVPSAQLSGRLGADRQARARSRSHAGADPVTDLRAVRALRLRGARARHRAGAMARAGPARAGAGATLRLGLARLRAATIEERGADPAAKAPRAAPRLSLAGERARGRRRRRAARLRRLSRHQLPLLLAPPPPPDRQRLQRPHPHRLPRGGGFLRGPRADSPALPRRDSRPRRDPPRSP